MLRSTTLAAIVFLCAATAATAPAHGEASAPIPGAVDRAFATRGTLALDPVEDAGDVRVRTVVTIDRSGHILAADRAHGLAVARFSARGRRDVRFGDGGRVVAAAPAVAGATATAVDPDGRILLAGAVPDGTRIVLARLDPEGRLDPAFGDDGIAAVALDGPVAALRLDGRRPLVVGQRGWLARLTETGAPDPAFGDHGIARFTLAPVTPNGSDELTDVLVAADGTMVASSVAIFNDQRGAQPETTLHWLGPDGAVLHERSTSGDITALLPRAGGGLLTAGGINFDDIDPEGGTFGLLRAWRADGRVDRRFGRGGAVDDLGIDAAQRSGAAYDRAGRIVTSGATGLMRFADDGTRDMTFGWCGVSPWIEDEDFEPTGDTALLVAGRRALLVSANLDGAGATALGITGYRLSGAGAPNAKPYPLSWYQAEGSDRVRRRSLRRGRARVFVASAQRATATVSVRDAHTGVLLARGVAHTTPCRRQRVRLRPTRHLGRGRARDSRFVFPLTVRVTYENAAGRTTRRDRWL